MTLIVKCTNGLIIFSVKNDNFDFAFKTLGHTSLLKDHINTVLFRTLRLIQAFFFCFKNTKIAYFLFIRFIYKPRILFQSGSFQMQRMFVVESPASVENKV